MKRRHGFVSNSSSSSFIVAFPKIPKSAYQVKKMLFPNGEKTFEHPYGGGVHDTNPDSYPTKQVAETVFNDMKGQKVFRRKRSWLIGELVEAGWIGDSSFSFDINKEGKPTKKAATQERAILVGIKKVDEFLAQADPGGLFIYRFEYGDDDGSYFCALEHGDLFSALPHFRISNH